MRPEEYIQAYAAYCQEQEEKIRSRLARYPKGKLHAYKYRGGHVYRICADGGSRYVHKDEQDLKIKMAQKAFCEARLKDLTTEHDACGRFLKVMSRHPHAVDRLMLDEGMLLLLGRESDIANESLKKWMYDPYPRYQGYPEGLTVKSAVCGHVRSKSEAMCVMMLLEMGIPFHYEQIWSQGDKEFYPDFTLRHPKDGRYFIMEIFGMMDDPGYISRTFQKLRQYAEYGWIQDKNLLCFFETKDSPLDLVRVKNVLTYYFLDR